MSDFDIGEMDNFLNELDNPQRLEKASGVSNPKVKEIVKSQPSKQVTEGCNTHPGSTRKAKLERDPKTGDIINLYVSQSLIKKFFFKGNERDYCPRFIKEVYVNGSQVVPSTESQLKGLYFETLCLGETTSGSSVTDLPRKKNGEKRIEQVRIDEQALKFPLVLKHNDMKVLSKHERKVGIFNSSFPFNVFITGELDFTTPITFKGKYIPKVVCDLKLTKDISSDFGAFAWGDPARMDHIQGDIYSWLWGLPFFYAVFDYKSSIREHDIIPVNTIEYQEAFGHNEKYEEARQRRQDTNESIRKTISLILDYELNGWIRKRCPDHCRLCQYSVKNYKNTGKPLCENSINEV
jgi:hypothetical protein